MASLTSSGYSAWVIGLEGNGMCSDNIVLVDYARRLLKVEAREKSDFSILAPVLREWVDVLKQKATCIDATRPVYEVGRRLREREALVASSLLCTFKHDCMI